MENIFEVIYRGKEKTFWIALKQKLICPRVTIKNSGSTNKIIFIVKSVVKMLKINSCFEISFYGSTN